MAPAHLGQEGKSLVTPEPPSPLESVGSAGRSRHGLRRQSGPAAPRQRPKGTLTFANLCPGPHGASYGARGILGGVWGMNPSTASLANSSISRLNGTPARAAQHERAGRRWPTGEVSAHGTICLSVAARSPSPQTVGVVAATDRLDRLGRSGARCLTRGRRRNAARYSGKSAVKSPIPSPESRPTFARAAGARLRLATAGAHSTRSAWRRMKAGAVSL